jgi:hypothetical protein
MQHVHRAMQSDGTLCLIGCLLRMGLKTDFVQPEYIDARTCSGVHSTIHTSHSAACNMRQTLAYSATLAALDKRSPQHSS